MNSDPVLPPDFLTDKPNVARMYDYFLGGFHNFEIDRIAAEQVIAVHPDVPQAAWVNRAFLRRAVQFLAAQGIDQLLDIGSGIPTAGNVHEIAQKINPATRIVYVDIDPIAVRHSNMILESNPQAVAIRADARQPEQILAYPEVLRLLDFKRPLGLLLVAMLHFVGDDEEAYRLVRVLRDALAPGSYVAISHISHEGFPPEVVAQMEELYTRSTNPVKVRSRVQIARFFEGLELVEPGLVYAPAWRPEDASDLSSDRPERSGIFAGIGCKR